MNSEHSRACTPTEGDNCAPRIRSPIPLPDADDSGFSEFGGVNEGPEFRTCRRKSNLEEVPNEAVFWESSFLGSSTPYQHDRFSGNITPSRWDQSTSTLEASAEVLEIDFRRRSLSGSSVLNEANTIHRGILSSPYSKPWHIDSPSTFHSQQRSCGTRTSSFCSEPQANRQGNNLKNSGDLDVSQIVNDVGLSRICDDRGNTSTCQHSNQANESKSNLMRRVTNDDTNVYSTNYLDLFPRNNLPRSSTLHTHSKQQTDKPRVEESTKSSLDTEKSSKDADNAESFGSDESKVITEMDDSGLYYLRQTVKDTSNNVKSDSSHEMLQAGDNACNVYSQKKYHSRELQEDCLYDEERGINNGDHLQSSYKTLYSDVSDEEAEIEESANIIKSSDIDEQKNTNLSEASDSDSTNELALEPRLSSPESMTRIYNTDQQSKPRLKVKRKMYRPRRSAAPKDPRFRGITMWLQTQFKNGQSNLHISAFYSNVKPGCRQTTSSRTCHQDSSSPDIHSCSDTEGNSLYNYVKICASCRTRRTPLWRDAEDGTPLCNACGIRYKKYRLRCSKCWHIPKKEIKTYPNCPVCGASLRYTFHSRKAW